MIFFLLSLLSMTASDLMGAVLPLGEEIQCPSSPLPAKVEESPYGEIWFTKIIAQKGKCRVYRINLSGLSDIGRDGSDLNYSKYIGIAQALSEIKKEFQAGSIKTCPDTRSRSEQIEDSTASTPQEFQNRSRAWMDAIAFENLQRSNVADATSTPGVHERQMAKITTSAMAKQEMFCSKVSQIRHELFGKDRIFRSDATLDDYVNRYNIDSCRNPDFQKLVTQVKRFDIEGKCSFQPKTTPFCAVGGETEKVLAKIGYPSGEVSSKKALAQLVTQQLISTINEQLPLFEAAIREAEKDLDQVHAVVQKLNDQLVNIGQIQPGQDNLRPNPRMKQKIVDRELTVKSKPYDDIIQPRAKLLEAADGVLSELANPVRTELDAELRLQYLLRYAPQFVYDAFNGLEKWVQCNPNAKNNIARLKVGLCLSYQAAKKRRDTEVGVTDFLKTISALSYAGSFAAGVTGNPAAAGLATTGLVTGSLANLNDYFIEAKLKENRAFTQAIMGDMASAAAYLQMRDDLKSGAIKGALLDAAGLVLPGAGKLLGKATGVIRGELSVLRELSAVERAALKVESIRTVPFVPAGVTSDVVERAVVLKVVSSSKSIVETQLDFLMAKMPGLTNLENSTVVRQQLLNGLEYAYKRNQRVVFGGSRVRGNSSFASDLDIGFGSAVPEGVTGNNEVAKMLSKFRSQESSSLNIEHTKIYGGGGTQQIERIQSPEEFFQRSGMRSQTDMKAGQTYNASGSFSLFPDGTIVYFPP